MNKYIRVRIAVVVLAGVVSFGTTATVYAAEEIDAYCAAPTAAVPHGSTVTLTIKFADSDKSNSLIVQGPFRVLRYENGKAIIVDAKRGNEKDEMGKENTEKPTLAFTVNLTPKHKLPAPGSESVTLTYFVKHKEGKRGELFTTDREQQVDCAFVVQHEAEEPTTPKNITALDLGVEHSGTLPASRFYFLKEWQRSFARLFTWSVITKVELELRIANEKAAEALATALAHPDDAEALTLAFENYTGAVERLEIRLAALKETSENPRVEKLLLRIDEHTWKHAQLVQQLTQRFYDDPYAEDVHANAVNPEAARDNHLQGAADSAQRKIQEVVILVAEKDKAIAQKAEEQIKRTDTMLGEFESQLAEFVREQSAVTSAKTGPIRLDPTPARLSTNMTIERQTPKRDFGDRMKAGLDQAGGILANGKARLVSAKSAFALGKFGEAYGQARSGEMLAVHAARVFQDILYADHGGLEDGIKSGEPRSGSDADAPRVEDMNSVMPTIVPGTGKIVPEVEKKESPPTGSNPPPIVRDVSGYTYDITGYVYDVFDAPAMTTGIPVGGVAMRAIGPKTFIAQTRSDGSYTISFINAPLGTYDVCVTPPSGYRMNNPPSGCANVVVRLLHDTTVELTTDGHVALNGQIIYFGLMRQMDNGCPTGGTQACGKDGRTYYNACFATKAGVEVSYDGECRLGGGQ